MWLYHWFTLSFRYVEDLLLERSVTVSDKTVRLWCRTVGPPLCLQPLNHQFENCRASQHLVRTPGESGDNGIAYDSVRRISGECAAVFRPPLFSNARPEPHLCYIWDG